MTTIVLESGRRIGDGQPPYIIAEVGSNWKTEEDCMESIHQAKMAGADAVKFQWFTKKELYGFGENPDPVTNPFMPGPWIPRLKTEADKRGIDFMCTAFSPEGYDIVNQYVDIHKVASSECCHLRILQKLKQLGKPVILSTGAKSATDIKRALWVLDNTPTVLMYCVVSYPAHDMNLDTIKNFKETFKNKAIGYSDHSVDVCNIPRLAVEKGAAVIEKHFTIIPDVMTPDQPHSLDPAQFRNMVKSIRGELTAQIAPTPEEKTALLRYNRRLIVTKDVQPGDTLQEGVNYGIYRSLKDDVRAAHPFMVTDFQGKRVRVSMKAGDGLWIEDVQ